MSGEIRIRKGLDIRLQGSAEKVYMQMELSGKYMLSPLDFPMLVPRLLVKPGDAVQAGTPLFCDKKDPRVLFVSPVSGTVADVVRGARRRIERVEVDCPQEPMVYKDFGKQLPATLDRNELVTRMLEGGVWPFIRQRPYNVVANPDLVPRAIFISAFDSAPLAPDLDFSIKDGGEAFQVGLDVLAKLTGGKVYLTMSAKSVPNPIFSNARGVEKREIRGPHPAGTVGVQINHIAPIAKGEVVWTVGALDVVIIGRLFTTGHYDARRVVALAGSLVRKPRYYLSMQGMPIENFVKDQVAPEADARYISGDVLTGTNEGRGGNLRFFDTLVTVIPEGNHSEFMGWASPGLNKFSASRLFPSFLRCGHQYVLDTNLNGGLRAYVVTGQYEKVFPMDIYPVRLVKAIMAHDIEAMEDLGIYEVIPEDFALCEFVCTSKIEVQSVVREGLEFLYKELN